MASECPRPPPTPTIASTSRSLAGVAHTDRGSERIVKPAARLRAGRRARPRKSRRFKVLMGNRSFQDLVIGEQRNWRRLRWSSAHLFFYSPPGPRRQRRLSWQTVARKEQPRQKIPWTWCAGGLTGNGSIARRGGENHRVGETSAGGRTGMAYRSRYWPGVWPVA